MMPKYARRPEQAAGKMQVSITGLAEITVLPNRAARGPSAIRVDQLPQIMLPFNYQ
jgi:hypothetical protein